MDMENKILPYTQDECMANHKAAWAAADANGNGFLSMDEARTFYKALQQENKKSMTPEQAASVPDHSDEKCDQQIATVELSDDGKITFDAICAANMKTKEASGWKFKGE